MGRNMFGPGRGDWDETWTGWWGPNPPYHAPVFVLTHHPRADRDGGWHHVHVRHRWDRIGARAGSSRCGDRDVEIAGGSRPPLNICRPDCWTSSSSTSPRSSSAPAPTCGTASLASLSSEPRSSRRPRSPTCAIEFSASPLYQAIVSLKPNFKVSRSHKNSFMLDLKGLLVVQEVARCGSFGAPPRRWRTRPHGVAAHRSTGTRPRRAAVRALTAWSLPNAGRTAPPAAR